MTLSLNEIEATAKKATRGAGYPWGLAEEAGKATRWLCAHDLEGCAALAGLLNRIDRADIMEVSPVAGDTVWTAIGGSLCPVATGAAISDRAHEISEKETRLGEIIRPILLAPFAAYVAQQIGMTVQVKFQEAEFCTDGEQISLNGRPQEVSSWASIAVGGAIDNPTKRCQRCDPDADDWKTLTVFAHRTYAPATKESRIKGAGAGLSDND